mmetsp:Transcript_49969/g.79065  ORF Transcript_49969/g.79065 Transcript_49969/m.79065 type:complete len:162 (-) Transcript_49969:117-602(-)
MTAEMTEGMPSQALSKERSTQEDISLQPALLLSDTCFQRRTCGMKSELVKELRLAARSKEPLRLFCESLLLCLPGENTAIIIAGPVGPPTATALRGQGQPKIVIWLLLDEINIDSKQTTFVHSSVASSEQVFASLYKLRFTRVAEKPMLMAVKEDGTSEET